jgi:hypothetical protein
VRRDFLTAVRCSVKDYEIIALECDAAGEVKILFDNTVAIPLKAGQMYTDS